MSTDVEKQAMESKMSASSPVGTLSSDTRVTLVDVLTALGEEKKLFLGCWFVGTALVVAIVLALPRTYSSTTVILPPQQQQSAAAGALAQLGALAGVAGVGGAGKTPEEMYVAFMKTQRLRSALVAKLALKDHYGLASSEETRSRLDSMVQVSNDKKTGLISVTVDDKDPSFAAKLANAHVDELRLMLSTLAVTEAQQRRVFFEQQVAKAQAALRAAEVTFRREQERNGFVVMQALAESGAKTQIELQSQIAAREVQLSALAQFMTTQSQEVQRVRAEIAALRRQLQTLQSGSGREPSADNPGQMAAIKAYRDMKIQEAALEVLVRQLEIARLDEAKEGPLLQQVDVAMPPEKPSKPKRLYVVVAASMVSFLLGTVLAVGRWSGRRRLSDPAALRRWTAMRKAWF